MTVRDDLAAVFDAAKVSGLSLFDQSVADHSTALAAKDQIIADLRAQIPVAPTFKTQFGACPNKAGKDAVAKWGAGAVVRIFKTAIAPITRPAGASRVHVSYGIVSGNRDAALIDLAAGKYDTQITAAAKGTMAGDVLEIIHEADKKITDGVATWGPVLAAKNHFYDVVKKANPDVLVANTVTGWLADPKSGNDFQRWGQIKADIIGIDCDGVNPKALPYPNYDGEIAAAVAFVKKYAANGYKYWSVPEFCATRMPVDPQSVERVKWMVTVTDKFKADKALYVAWYDYDMSVGNELTLTNEINAWSTLVKGS